MAKRKLFSIHTSLSEEELELSEELDARLLDLCFRFLTKELLSESEDDLRFFLLYRSCFRLGGLTGLYRRRGEWCFDRRRDPFLWLSELFSASFESLLFIKVAGDILDLGESLFLWGSIGEKLLDESNFLTSLRSLLFFSLNDFLSSYASFAALMARSSFSALGRGMQ